MSAGDWLELWRTQLVYCVAVVVYVYSERLQTGSCIHVHVVAYCLAYTLYIIDTSLYVIFGTLFPPASLSWEFNFVSFRTISRYLFLYLACDISGFERMNEHAGVFLISEIEFSEMTLHSRELLRYSCSCQPLGVDMMAMHNLGS